MFFTNSPSRWRTALIGGLLASVSLISGSSAEKSQADYFVRELPGAPLPLLKMHAGYVVILSRIHMETNKSF